LVDLRCSVVIVRNDAVLLLHRGEADEWVLPGGRPRPGESMLSCARREVHEETGLHIDPGRCAFVLEVAAPDRAIHIVELVFLANPRVGELQVHGGEPGRKPQWVALADLAGVPLRPPIAGHLRALAHDRRQTAAYLGNVWRPAPGATTDEDPEAGSGLGP
jgi:ADP-ribose pyrophosphatase YjhB (NUDIX family)